MLKAILCAALMAVTFVGIPIDGKADETEQSLVSFSAGALLVQRPTEYDENWSAFWMLDERPESGWASPKGNLENHIAVIELAEKTLLNRLEFDTGSADGNDGRGAKDVLVEISNEGPGRGFQRIAEVTLADKADRQSFPVTEEIPGRWVRLSIKNNHGSSQYTELMDFRAYGSQLTHTPFPDASGTYKTNYNDFHLVQQGTSVSGCYEYKEGTLNGGIESRIMKIDWRETDRTGPAIIVFSADGKRFFGLWWFEGEEMKTGKIWNGTLISKKIGGCPHWKGGVQEEMTKELARHGRVRVYGINFDVDSATIRDESKPTLDKIVAMLTSDAKMQLTIEGHTDSSGTAEHNQVLSQNRAESVKSYLAGAGIAPERISTVGFGAKHPVAPNSTAMGKAQNRRVELVRK